MWDIRTKKDALVAYAMLDYYERVRGTAVAGDLIDEHVADIKRGLRRFFQKSGPEDRHLVKSDSESYIELVELPASLTTQEDADWYFMEHEFMERPCSMYDCTGKLFTSWYKIFTRRGRFMAYHSVCMDV